MYAMIGGQPTPGTIPARGGMRGFKRETGWDIKAGKGIQGATLTLKTLPPVEGTVTCQLINDNDFANWDALVINVLSISPAKQRAAGLPWYYPGHTSIGLTSVVVKHYTPPEHQGKGLYLVSFEIIEWSKPPKTSIVSTVQNTIPTIVIVGQNPEIAALEQQIAQQQALQKGAMP
jgi:hypothetical protein